MADTDRTRVNLADEDLMQLMRQGDAQAFEVIYERHSGAAFSLAYRKERFEAQERTDLQAARSEDAAEVQSALASSPAEQSRAIELAYFGGFSHSEIATMLEMPVGTVKGRIRLGLEKLRGRLSHVMEVPA